MDRNAGKHIKEAYKQAKIYVGRPLDPARLLFYVH